jgi:predicted ATPase
MRLRRRALLICLDTCEHVLDAAAAVASQLLETAPGLRVIATSREPLAVDGEAVWRVPSLLEDEAARLFVERAELVGAQMSAADDPAVRAICRRVDCLALAVELAAPWAIRAHHR